MIVSLLLSLTLTQATAHKPTPQAGAEKPTNAFSLNDLLDKGARALESSRLPVDSEGPRLPFYSLKWPTPVPEKPLYETVEGKGSGLHIKGNRGSDVIAPASGTVKYVGSLGNHESVVIVDHRQRTQTIYIGLDKRSVKVGQNVYSGQRFAKLPSYGSAVHEYFFELRHNGKAMDPLPYLNRRG